MNIITEIEFRVTKALDFLSGLKMPDGKFIAYQDHKDVGDANLALYLQAVSTLLSGEIFNKHNLINTANQMMIPVDNATFIKDNTACIVSEETSSTIGNALAVFTAHKRGKIDLALAFARSLLICIGKNEVSFFYEPGTKQEEVRKHRSEGACGFVSLALLKAYRLSNDPSFLSHAENVIGIAMQKGRFDHLDLWAMKLIGNREEYQSRASHLIQVLNSKPIEQLPLMTTAMILMSNLAWPEFSHSGRNELLLKHIFSLQSDSGSFSIGKNHDEMDTLSIIRAINTMLAYLPEKFDFPPIL